MANPRIKCPTCRKTGDWFAGTYGPFCSQRCQLIDLGKWLEEEHRVSVPATPEMPGTAVEAATSEHLGSGGAPDPGNLGPLS
ncbi:MAG TPA: DNA gyrase inhibitor YacG [Verrucomicrobiota bacterium]|nr:DNA gyrase inhibitor YacG [Verrucomicrobiota bacterium]HNT13527.1 DNA gyrase inhibitor YacG [Verrucomicrobiota bacterium]